MGIERVGTQVSLRSSEEALKACNMNWEVYAGQIKHIKGDGTEVHCPNFVGVFRKDTDFNLGIVGKGYSLGQNSQAASISDDIIALDPDIEIIRGGEIFHGDKLFLNLRLGKDIQIGPEMFRRIIMIAWAHDGGLSISGNFFLYRLATKAILKVDAKEINTSIKIRHSGDMNNKIKMARNIMKEAYKFFENLENKLEILSVTPMTDGDFQGMLSKIFPDAANAGKGQSRTDNKRNEVFALYQAGMGANNVKGSQFGGLLAITEYCNNAKSTRVEAGKDKDEVELNGLLFGTRTAEISEAFKLMLSSMSV